MTLKIETTRCPCGSGLRKQRCCDLDLSNIPDPANMAVLDKLVEEARAELKAKKLREAEFAILKLLDIAPTHRGALRLLIEIRQGENQPRPVQALLRRLASLPAENAASGAQVCITLAQALIGQTRHAEAIAVLLDGLRLMPRDSNLHHMIGMALTETGDLLGGEIHYRIVLDMLAREDAICMGNLAWNLKLQGRLEEAKSLYEKSLAARPENTRAVSGLAQTMAQSGNYPQAEKLLDDLLEKTPGDRTAGYLRALCDINTGKPQAALDRFAKVGTTLSVTELAGKGEAYDRLGQTREAINAFNATRRFQTERLGHHYQPEPFKARAERLRGYFTAERVAGLPRGGATGSFTPVFLLGVPRSGSSLLERLLAQIPGFAPADDRGSMKSMPDFAARFAGKAPADFPEALDEALVGERRGMMDALRRHYEERVMRTGIAGPDTKFVTDRAHGNLWELGLIGLMYPEAPIVHVIRHPLDVVLSQYGNDKRMEADSHVSIEALAQHYDLQMSLIRHIRGQMTLRYLPVRFEDLVRAPASTLARVFRHIGVAPPKQFARTTPPRIPAHFALSMLPDRSRAGRFTRYEETMPEFLAPARMIVDPWIATLGYADDTALAA